MIDLILDALPLLNKVVPVVLMIGSGLYIAGSTLMYLLSGGALGDNRRVLFKRYIKVLAGVTTIVSTLFVIEEIGGRFFASEAPSEDPPQSTPRSVTPSQMPRSDPASVTAMDIPNFDFPTPAFQIIPEARFVGTALEISKNGTFIAHATTDFLGEVYIDIFLAQTGDQYARLYGHDAVVRSMAFSFDGELLVSGDEAGQVVVWSLGSKAELGRFVDEPALGTSNAIQLHTQVAVSDDGMLVAYGGMTETLTIRQIASTQVLGRVPLHSGGLTPMDFGPVGLNSYRMETLGNNERLDEGYGWASRALNRVREPISDIAFSGDGARVAVISRGTKNDVHILQSDGGVILEQLSCRRFDAGGEDRAGSFEPTAITFAPFTYDVYFGGSVLVPDGSDRGSSIRIWRRDGDSCEKVFFTAPEMSGMSDLNLTFDGSIMSLPTRTGFLFLDVGAGLVRQQETDENVVGYECGTYQKSVRLASSAPILLLADCALGRPTLFRQ